MQPDEARNAFSSQDANAVMWNLGLELALLLRTTPSARRDVTNLIALVLDIADFGGEPARAAFLLALRSMSLFARYSPQLGDEALDDLAAHFERLAAVAQLGDLAAPLTAGIRQRASIDCVRDHIRTLHETLTASCYRLL